ncbi:hypothetical protein [Methylobacterium sp. J-076]|uniref:hypothetical protein n=1 Tax=Methylobacterium sp. J-076 TaxID=2836655 RepID=UPI001FBB2AF9|nr:hypothetical protein [Methylobacterium sp. J-076]MCJ2012611.1 hypothetical protein [Methylobacterium sp. J-076]
MRKRTNLVITRAGPGSLHRQWLHPQEARNFDVLVTSYHGSPAEEAVDGVEVVFLPGKKVEGWRRIVSHYAERLEGYERIAFLDDDIACDATALSACFDIGRDYNLALWQPSLTWSSYFTYGGTLHNDNFKLRYVNYIEMMCPFFTRSALKQIEPTFFLGLESGIDLLWCSLIPPQDRRCAIIDEVQVLHTRPVGRDKAANGFTHHSYEDEIETCLKHFRMPWPSLVAGGAVLSNGGAASRLSIAWRVLSLIRALRVTPDPRGLRQIFDHIRHQILRRQVYNECATDILKTIPDLATDRGDAVPFPLKAKS